MAVIVVILIATGGGGTKTGQAAQLGSERPTVAEVTALVGGIPQSGNTLGDPNAPVTLQYFGDLECPICKEFTLGALPAIIQKWVRTGKLKIEYHSLETATREPEVFKTQQVAALAAGKQNKAWDFIETLLPRAGRRGHRLRHRKLPPGPGPTGAGAEPRRSGRATAANPALANEVESDEQAANNAGFTGTPSFLIGKTGGR